MADRPEGKPKMRQSESRDFNRLAITPIYSRIVSADVNPLWVSRSCPSARGWVKNEANVIDKNANKLWIAGREMRGCARIVSGVHLRRYLHGLIDGSAPTPHNGELNGIIKR